MILNFYNMYKTAEQVAKRIYFIKIEDILRLFSYFGWLYFLKVYQ
jgi:hypothetical protein